MPSTLSELLRLPADERAQLAMALWDSLADCQRQAELSLTAEQAAELDRRWAEHLKDPDSAIPWDEVRRRLERPARRCCPFSFGPKPKPTLGGLDSGTNNRALVWATSSSTR